MTAITAHRGMAISATRRQLSDSAFQAFTVLRVGFTVAPILFGVDKFLDWLVDRRISCKRSSTTSPCATSGCCSPR